MIKFRLSNVEIEEGVYTTLEMPLSVIVSKILPELEEEYRNWMESELTSTNPFPGTGFLEYLEQKYGEKTNN